MAQKPAGASILITNTNCRRNICPSEKVPFEKVAEDFSKQKLTLLNCDWEQSARIIQMSRVNEHLSNLLYRQNTNPLSGPTCLLLPQFNTCSSAGVFDRLLVKKSFDLLRLFLNASHMGFCMFFKLSIPFCRRSFGKGRFQIPVQ